MESLWIVTQPSNDMHASENNVNEEMNGKYIKERSSK